MPDYAYKVATPMIVNPDIYLSTWAVADVQYEIGKTTVAPKIATVFPTKLFVFQTQEQARAYRLRIAWTTKVLVGEVDQLMEPFLFYAPDLTWNRSTTFWKTCQKERFPGCDKTEFPKGTLWCGEFTPLAVLKDR